MSSLAERLAAARRASDDAPASDPNEYDDATTDAMTSTASATTTTTTTTTRPASDAPSSHSAPALHGGPGATGYALPSGPGHGAGSVGHGSGSGSTGQGSRSGGHRTAGDSAMTSRRTTTTEHERLEELKTGVHTELLKQLGPHLYDADMDQEELDRRVRSSLTQLLGSQERPISNADRNRLTQEISDDILGYGPIEPFLRDPDVSEVMVNGYDSIFLERKGKLVSAKAQFSTEAHLRRTIDKIVSRIGRRVDESSPMVDARLPDGSRVNAVIPPWPSTARCSPSESSRQTR